MQAYATPQRLSRDSRLRHLDAASQDYSGGLDPTMVDLLLAQLADLVVDRLIDRTASANQPSGEWLDARTAADYLRIHRNTLRKLAAERAIPVHQDGPRCKLYFRRDELDEWRTSSSARRLRAVS